MAAERVSTMEVRARIGDMLNRVALRHDEFIITRKGKALAALVPVERLEQMRAFAKAEGQKALAELEQRAMPAKAAEKRARKASAKGSKPKRKR